MTINTEAEAMEHISFLIQQSKANLDKAIEIAREWGIEMSYHIFNPEGGHEAGETWFSSDDDWSDSGC